MTLTCILSRLSLTCEGGQLTFVLAFQELATSALQSIGN